MSTCSTSIKIASGLAAIALTLPTPVLAEWMLVVTASDKTKMYVDPASIVRKGHLVQFTTSNVYPFPQSHGETTAVDSQIMSCQTGEWKLQHTTDYNNRNQVVYNDSYGEDEGYEAPAQPGSSGDAIKKFVCSR